MRYYTLNTPGSTEVARLSRGGNAFYFDATTRRWIPDPLLAVELRHGNDWRVIEPHDLPPGVADVVVETPRARKFRVRRRGRHSRK
jgi:hypothetical protein